jgi:hypothetical protein
MSTNLEQITHRPRPLPAGPWIMAQSWHDLLFAHWCVDEAALRRHIPAEAELISNTMPEADGIYIAPEKPLLHFAKRQDVVVWQPKRLAR